MNHTRTTKEHLRPRIAPELVELCQATKPSWLDTTSWINELIAKGLAGVAGHVTLGEPSEQHDTPREKRGSTSITYIDNKKKNAYYMSKKNLKVSTRDVEPRFEKITDYSLWKKWKPYKDTM